MCKAKGKTVNVELIPEATTPYNAATLLINAGSGFRRKQAFRRKGGSRGGSF